jgi:N4-(beta-N-acetylglucosaminyl)-L-asparaginase
MGFKIEDDLNTEKSRRLWLEWKRRTDKEHYPNPKDRAEAGRRVGMAMVAEGLVDPQHIYGTINCNAVNAKGEIAGVTTTSGLAWKIPGRVGDSPIIGAGLYVDGDVGAAGSTGRGEANLFSLASFWIVEEMRNGMSPQDAGMAALKRIAANTIPDGARNVPIDPQRRISDGRVIKPAMRLAQRHFNVAVATVSCRGTLRREKNAGVLETETTRARGLQR